MNQVYACPECKSMRVQHEMWVDMNDESVMTEGGSDDIWCENCQEHIRSVIQIDESETLEAKGGAA